MPENTNPEQPKSDLTEKEIKTQLTNKKILAFSLEFGFMIAIPLVVFAFLGKYLAAHYHNQGYFYGGIILALFTSVAWFWKRITDIYNDFIK